MHRIPDLDTGIPPQNRELTHLTPLSHPNGHGQHHEQEMSKTLPNEEHFPGAPPISLPVLKVQPCLVLAVGSELRVAPASPLAHQQQPWWSWGATKTWGKGKSCKLEIPFSPTNKNQEHFTHHSHIHHPGIPVQLLGLSCASPPLDPDPPPVIMGSAKSLSFKTSDPLTLPNLNHLKMCCLSPNFFLQDTGQKGVLVGVC